MVVERELEGARARDRQAVSQVPASGLEEISELQGLHVDRELNLKGKVCPYTFVESMLALEEMEIGQVLRIILDHAPAVCDVPRSLTREGYEILAIDKVNNTDWAIVVRNKDFDQG